MGTSVRDGRGPEEAGVALVPLEGEFTGPRAQGSSVLTLMPSENAWGH